MSFESAGKKKWFSPSNARSLSWGLGPGTAEETIKFIAEQAATLRILCDNLGTYSV